MREVAPTRSAAIELADERRLMRQGYEFLDEKRMLLASEILRQLRDYEAQAERLIAATKTAAEALAATVERHGLDGTEVYLSPPPPEVPPPSRGHFLGIPMLTAGAPPDIETAAPPAVDPSPEARACRTAFEALLWAAADLAPCAGNLARLAREYRRTERRAKALEKVLLPEVEEAIKRVGEQLDTMEREEVILTRWATRGASAE